MRLSFLPKHIQDSLQNLNWNFLTEIRLRLNQPVIVEYSGEYNYLGRFGLVQNKNDAIFCENIVSIFNSAVDGSVYNYTEQIKNGFITVSNGVRIGISGEYVISGGKVITIKSPTSLNIRIPHNVFGCADVLCKRLFSDGVKSTLLFSRAGLGKTTYLREMAKFCSNQRLNTLVFDERNEISAMDGYGKGYDLGEWVDVVRASDKLSSIQNAIRAMKPRVIITDELYGEQDFEAVKYAQSCGIAVFASTHIEKRDMLKKMSFDYYVKLIKIAKEPIVYDKDFNTCFGDNFDNDGGISPVVEEEKQGKTLCRASRF